MDNKERCRGTVDELMTTIELALRASVQMTLKPSDAPGTIALWDDGLDSIR